MEESAGLLGPGDVTFHSRDNKAKVLIELTVVSKQAPLLMHMEYKVTLLDHNYVISTQHKLISSVIGDMRVREKDFSGDFVTYSRPTDCVIRSAYNNRQDMKSKQSFDTFDDSFNNDTGESKPVMGVRMKIQDTQKLSNYFTTQGLDAFFLATNSPRRNTFYRIERRMVKFSQELRGIVLSHDKFGSHLNSKKKTIDPGLEKKNVMYAGQILTEIELGIIINGYPALAE